MPYYEEATPLNVEIDVGGVVGSTTWRCLVAIQRRLRSGPPEIRTLPLLLDWPTRQRPSVVLYIGAGARQREAVEAAVQVEAAAAGRDVRVRLGAVARSADLGLAQLEHRAELRARFGECLACATDIHLDSDSSARRAFGYRERQNLVLALLALGLDTLSQGCGDWAPYPAYHRDWLIRCPILQTGNGFGSASKIRRLLDEQLIRLGHVDRAGLRRLSAAAVRPALAESWVGRVRALETCLAELAGDARFRVDVFAGDAVYPVVFRLFHSLARQFGIALLDEALLHHLFAAAGGVVETGSGFCLAPHLDELASAEPRPMMQATKVVGEGLPWKELVAASGAEGRQWTAAYQRSEAAVGDHLTEALRLLRAGDLQAGYRQLELAGTYRDTIREECPGIYHVLGRFVHGEVAYYHYRAGDFARARLELNAAAASIRDAIEVNRFLVPIAPMAVDVPLQRARVAKAELEWDAVRGELGVLRDLQVGRRALVKLRDGTEVTYATVGDYCASLDLPAASRASVRELLDPDERLCDFRRHSSKLYVVPGLVMLDALVLPDPAVA